MVLSCSCYNLSQDHLHGKGRRVHNPCKPKDSTPKFRCTVCGNERTALGYDRNEKGDKK